MTAQPSPVSLRHLSLLLAVLGSWSATLPHPAIAQITPDATLPNNSVVSPPAATRTITGGTRPPGSNNLFHSFSEFSIPSGNAVLFDNAIDIQNIFTRVTGGSVSSIDGFIGANGAANLFLLNPNGIVFGPNAQINIGGSFVGSSANSIRFGDGFEFTATSATPSPLLTISAPVGLQFGANPGIINVNNIPSPSPGLTVTPGLNFVLAGGAVTLDGGRITVPGGRVDIASVGGAGLVDLNLTGNDIRLNVPVTLPLADVVMRNGASINTVATQGGHITVQADDFDISSASLLQSGVAGAGSLSTPSGDITLRATGKARLDNGIFYSLLAPGSTGNTGNINVEAESVEIVNGGAIAVVGSGNGTNGNVTVRTTNEISVSGEIGFIGAIGGLYNVINPGGQGNAGNIAITGGSLALSNGAAINAALVGQGQGGNVFIDVRGDMSVVGESQFANSGIYSTASPGSIGSSGSITINADTVQVLDGGVISAAVGGVGNSGDIVVNGRSRVLLNGTSAASGFSSSIANFLDAESQDVEGRGGSITITTPALSLQNGTTLNATTRSTGDSGDIRLNVGTLEATGGGQIFTSAFSSGNAGNIVISASDIQISGRDATYDDRVAQYTAIFGNDRVVTGGGALSGLFANTSPTATGRGGAIQVSSTTLNLADGAQINASSQGTGSAGNLRVGATNTLRLNNASLQAAAAAGNVGQVDITAANLFLEQGSSILATARGTATGQPLTITSTQLRAADASQINASTFGSGNAGALTIRAADSVSVIGSTLTAGAQSGSTGAGGNLSITTDRLTADSGQLSTSTAGLGSAGNITLNLGSLLVQNGAQVTANTSSVGNAGNVAVQASGNVTIEGSNNNAASGLFTVSSAAATGRAGDIQLEAQNLLLQAGGQVSADTLGIGNAGNLTVRIREDLTAIGESTSGQFASGLFSDVGQGAAGRGGNLNVTSDRLTLRNGAAISAATSGAGNAGTLTVNASRINLSGESTSGRNTTGFSTSTTNSGQGGDLSVMGDRLNISDGAIIRTGTAGSGDSGDLSIRVDRINISSENLLRPSANPRRLPGGISTAVQSPQATGQGGNLTVVSDRLTLRDSGQISASTLGRGNAGNVAIRADSFNILGNDLPGALQTNAVNAGVFTFSGQGARGNGGDVTIISDRFSVVDGGSVTAGTLGAGNAGDVTVRTRETVLQGGERTLNPTGLFSTSILGSSGQAGNVTLRGDRLRVLNGALIGTGTFTAGNAGDIRINVDDIEVSGAAPTGAISALRSSVENATATGQGGDVIIQGDRLRLLDGGQITSSTLGRGSAGDVRVNVRSVELSGAAPSLLPNGSSTQGVRSFRNSNISAAAVSPTGNNRAITGSAGSVTVTTDTLRVSNGAALSVSSLGSGNAGNLNIRANSVELNNGTLQAETNAGDQGNIRVTAPLINLVNGSRISTNAQGTATGGNIDINTEYLFALQNSDITANSTSNFGGQVSITAEGIFGAKFRPNLTPGNDITASSGLGTGFSGTVTLQTPNVEPEQGLVQLPETILDPNAQIASTCQSSAQSTFVVTGRGGVPTTPYDSLSDISPWSDLRDLSTSSPQESNSVPLAAVPVEATGWQMGRSGQMELVAIAPTPSQHPQQPTCASSSAK
jgi:filamentous hemagglutinin family protein